MTDAIHTRMAKTVDDLWQAAEADFHDIDQNWAVGKEEHDRNWEKHDELKACKDELVEWIRSRP